MQLDPELARLVSALSPAPPGDVAVLQEAGRELNIEWPRDYLALMIERDGGYGQLGEGHVSLMQAKELLPTNRALQHEPEPPGLAPNSPDWLKRSLEEWRWAAPPPPEQLRSGLIFFGSGGGGELLAFDRDTGAVLLVPAIGSDEDSILLGSTLVEALGHIERGDTFDDPVYPRATNQRETT